MEIIPDHIGRQVPCGQHRLDLVERGVADRAIVELHRAHAVEQHSDLEAADLGAIEARRLFAGHRCGGLCHGRRKRGERGRSRAHDSIATCQFEHGISPQSFPSDPTDRRRAVDLQL
jgi:hypothetical protein